MQVVNAVVPDPTAAIELFAGLREELWDAAGLVEHPSLGAFRT